MLFHVLEVKTLPPHEDDKYFVAKFNYVKKYSYTKDNFLAVRKFFPPTEHMKKTELKAQR